jgi:hypothetical protein
VSTLPALAIAVNRWELWIMGCRACEPIPPIKMKTVK